MRLRDVATIFAAQIAAGIIGVFIPLNLGRHFLQKMPTEIEWDEDAYYASRNLSGENSGDVSQPH